MDLINKLDLKIQGSTVLADVESVEADNSEVPISQKLHQLFAPGLEKARKFGIWPRGGGGGTHIWKG